MTPKQKFLALLAMLAKQTGEQVDDMRGEFYRMRLEPLGFEQVNAALADLLESARRFPTVAEIKQAMGAAEPSTNDAALMITDRVCAAVAKYGEVNADATMRGLIKALGPAAMEVVRRQGGWNQCVERAGDNLGVFRAQIRDSSQAYLKTGIIHVEEALAPLPPASMLAIEGRKEMAELEGSTIKIAEVKAPITIEFGWQGDITVCSGQLWWDPFGGKQRRRLSGDVTRTFHSWQEAGEFVQEKFKGNKHAESYMQQLGKARIGLAMKRALNPVADHIETWGEGTERFKGDDA